LQTFYTHPLHILILNYEYPPIGGGAGVISKYLTENFLKKGHKVTVITSWFHGEKDIEQEGNLEIIRLHAKRKKLFQSNPIEMYSWMKHTLEYLKKLQAPTYNICLTNFALPGGPPAYYLKEKYNIPYVILSHGHDIPWYYPKKMFLWHLLTYPWLIKLLNCSNYNVTASEMLKEIMDKRVKDRDKNLIITNGIETGNLNKKFEGDLLQIIFVGRLVHQKDPYTFLKTAKVLQEKGIPCAFIILGDGDMREKLEEYAIIHKIQNITFRGKVGHTEVLHEYQQSHILISTSLNEGMSVAILEAASHGLYIIATPASGNDKVIMEDINGHLVPYGDYHAIAEKVEYFYHKKFLVGFEHFEHYILDFEEKFSWSKIADQYITYFYRAIKDNRTKTSF
jgi:glycosyltransferase involved in cell wall biosynthesis